MYGINDSKKLTEKKREALFDEIVEKALAYKIIFVGPEIIDRDNILNATMGGMRQAVEGLDIVPNLVLVDGNRTPKDLLLPAQPVVKGDATSASIGAASVLAKVSRDRYMLELDQQYRGRPTRGGCGCPLLPETGLPAGGPQLQPAGREIDLILREPDGTLVFCEVKTRQPDSLTTPAEAVTPAKQRRILRTAQLYLQHTNQSDQPMRFDVAEVKPLDSGRWMVHIIKGAFTA